jgi:hypothetical protein
MIAFKIPALALAAMALCSFSPPTPPVPENGSFEKPVVPDGSYQIFNAGDKFKGWTVIGTGNVAIIGSDFTYCVALPAARGVQFLDLTGSSNSAAGVQTTIKTQPGSTYRLTFYVGNIVGSGDCGTRSKVRLVIDGAPAGSFTNIGGKDSNKIDWKKFGVDFTAEGDTTTIAFMNGDPPNDTANGLDGVSVKLIAGP